MSQECFLVFMSQSECSFQYFVSPSSWFLSPVSLLHLFSFSHTFIRYCYRRSHLPLVLFFARINFQFYDQHLCSQLFCLVSSSFFWSRTSHSDPQGSDSFSHFVLVFKCRKNASIIVIFSVLYLFFIIFAYQCCSNFVFSNK